MRERAELVGARLIEEITNDAIPATLQEAMLYSLAAGGKRLRPILLLAVLEAFGKPQVLGMPAACAIEMIHTYSLIHDDLPGMDNDDLRRGRPTNHKVYGEATAILAGDALLTHAFETVCRTMEAGVPAARVVQIVQELSVFAGAQGMVGGQCADMEGENRSLTLEELQYIHRHKTGDLLVFCVRAGALLGDASAEQLDALTTYAERIGLAFQIQDDILDVVGDEAKIGKPVGSDEERQKSTYPGLLGLDESRRLLVCAIAEAHEALSVAGLPNDAMLRALADFIMNRDH
ncbi:polyprenyl synthetase family protein [Aneurinibacillus soli]|nr:farnesyl diphosphate synthase [Aneurinibacillus soli]